MKQHMMTKTVRAEPMTRLQYNNLRGWKLPSDETGDDPGMLVEDINGASTVPGYSGYVQWGISSEFNRTTSISETHVDRLNIERNELASKVDSLQFYINEVTAGNTEEPVGFDIHIKQLDIMEQYLEILGIR